MKKLSKLLVSLMLGLCLVACVVGFTACDSVIDTTLPDSSPSDSIVDPEPEVVLSIENSFVYCYVDGVMQKDCEVNGYEFNFIGQLVADEEFVSINGDTYYFKGNAISYGYQVIDDHICYFGDDGIQVTDTVVDGNELDENGQLVANEVFFNIKHRTYYIVNNVIVRNYLILDGSIYYFDEDGVMAKSTQANGYDFDAEGKLTGDNALVTIGDDTYCVDGNELVNGYRLSGGSFYYFAEDYTMVKDTVIGEYYFNLEGKLEASEVFITVENNTYYIVNNVIVYNYQLIGENVYYFGNDGVMAEGETVDGYYFGNDGKLVADKIFITIENNTYYIVNNVIVYNYQVINGNVYYFGNDGVMAEGETVDSYYFGNDGKLVADKIFITIENNTYYIVNNVTVYSYQVIDGNVYYFGNDGVMAEGETVDNYYFGFDGKLVASEIFITIENNTYYIVNNVTVYNYYIIEGNVYYFGENGVMVKGDTIGEYEFDENGKLVANEIFITIENNTYYIVNNAIVYNYQVIDGNVYYFGADGAMVKDGGVGEYEFDENGKLVANEIFITIENNTYYVVNNVTVYNYQVIGGNVYYFGTDGAMLKGGEYEGYDFDANGKLVADKIFITIENNTYYIINNVTVYNYLVINGHIYYFGSTGIMTKEELVGEYEFNAEGNLVGDKTFVTVDGKTYYLENNTVVTGLRLMDGSIYYFAEDGVMAQSGSANGYYFGADGKLSGTNVLVTVENNTYCVTGNVIVNGYRACNGYIYYFDESYRMVKDATVGDFYFNAEGKLESGNGFIEIENNTYYIENNVIVYNYHIINGHVYYFGADGIMRTNTTVDGYPIGENGYIVVEDVVTIVINGNSYWIVIDTVQEASIVSGKVTESDNDQNTENNRVLASVQCIAVSNGRSYSTYTDSQGLFSFDQLPYGEATITFSLGGYYTASIDINLATEDIDLSIVLDREVSNTLTGRVTKADADTNATNNAALAYANVTIVRNTSTNVFTRSTTTNSSGYYTFTGLTAGVYTMTISCSGYITITQTVYVRYNDTTIQNVTIEAISSTQVAEGYAAGTLTDAKTGKAVSGINVIIRAGLGNTYGEIVDEVVTGSNGYYVTKALKPGNYTAQFVDKRSLADEDYRYGTVAIEIKVLSNTTISNQNATVSNSVGIQADSIRIVLTWGSTPRDLDSYLYTTLSNGTRYTVYYSSKRPYNGVNLDVDDTTSYGPETITISSVPNGVYKYYVHDFTNRSYSSSTYLANSGAKVNVYFGSTLAYTFNVPAGRGTCWHVFTYNATTGDFQVVNKISNSKGY